MFIKHGVGEDLITTSTFEVKANSIFNAKLQPIRGKHEKWLCKFAEEKKGSVTVQCILVTDDIVPSKWKVEGAIQCGSNYFMVDSLYMSCL